MGDEYGEEVFPVHMTCFILLQFVHLKNKSFFLSLFLGAISAVWTPECY
jgi:hypothetical protein